MNKFITLTWEFIKDKNYTMNEKLIYSEILNLSMLNKGCVAHNEHFANLMGIKKEAVSRLIHTLEEKGVISIQIINGSRNFSRIITINKMLFDHKQNVIEPLTKCLETKENKTININNNNDDDKKQKKSSTKKEKLENLKKYLFDNCRYKSKITITKKFEELFFKLDDRLLFANKYIEHQKEKLEFSKTLTNFILDYEAIDTYLELTKVPVK